LLIEAAEQLLAGDLEAGKAVLRDYINATVGFARLARETGTPSKSLMRMLGPKGNPRASNLLAVLSKCCSGFQEYIWRLRPDASTGSLIVQDARPLCGRRCSSLPIGGNEIGYRRF
jgi:hypothetical protein